MKPEMLVSTSVSEIFDRIIRSIGGKKIKTITAIYNDDNNFANTDKIDFVKANNAILLKNSHNLAFYTYNMRDRKELFVFPVSEIFDLYFAKYDRHTYTIVLFDGWLYWMLNIELDK